MMAVYSGGQTGVDICALRAAHRLGMRTGGFAPAGFMTCAGPNPELGALYGLQELRAGPDAYPARSRANVDAADAVLALRPRPSLGTDLTITYACRGVWARDPLAHTQAGAGVAVLVEGNVPTLVITTFQPRFATLVSHIHSFLWRRRPGVLNVCGPRECDEAFVERLLYCAFAPFAAMQKKVHS
ncbi:MAG TPA: putative molybdenum carrier protein [Ramlibacter sp.]|nr:putative molybdenum carrier protein [Ramlibacter sp.]